MTDNETDIKDMKLYSRVERIYNELRELGFKDDEPLDVESLLPFDQYHYFGTDTVDEGVRKSAITSASKVLDVGSGLGGPARYLAHKTGCAVTAIEIQPDVHAIASDLTRRCGLEALVTHQHADFLTSNEHAQYDVVVSWLAFLHIPDRARLLKRCLQALKPGGRLFVEDFHEIDAFTPEEQRKLAIDVYCEYLPTLAAFGEQCRSAGFVGVELDDITTAGRGFARERADSFEKDRARHARVHGEEVAAGLQHFFDVIAELFDGGRFGLVRVSASKPV